MEISFTYSQFGFVTIVAVNIKVLKLISKISANLHTYSQVFRHNSKQK